MVKWSPFEKKFNAMTFRDFLLFYSGTGQKPGRSCFTRYAKYHHALALRPFLKNYRTGWLEFLPAYSPSFTFQTRIALPAPLLESIPTITLLIIICPYNQAILYDLYDRYRWQ